MVPIWSPRLALYSGPFAITIAKSTKSRSHTHTSIPKLLFICSPLNTGLKQPACLEQSPVSHDTMGWCCRTSLLVSSQPDERFPHKGALPLCYCFSGSLQWFSVHCVSEITVWWGNHAIQVHIWKLCQTTWCQHLSLSHRQQHFHQQLVQRQHKIKRSNPILLWHWCPPSVQVGGETDLRFTHPHTALIAWCHFWYPQAVLLQLECRVIKIDTPGCWWQDPHAPVQWYSHRNTFIGPLPHFWLSCLHAGQHFTRWFQN